MSTTNATATAPQIYTLMSRVMADVGAVGKNQTNTHFKFKFRGIDDLQNAVQPALVKNGVCMSSEVLDERRDGQRCILKMRFAFYAPDGSSIASVTVGEGQDAQDKATNKAMSAALKYALLHTFCVPTEDQSDSDADGPVHAPAPVEQGPTTAQRVAAILRSMDEAATLADLSAIAATLKSEAAPVRDGVRARYETRRAELAPPAPKAAPTADEPPDALHEAVAGYRRRIAEIKSVYEATNWRKKHAAEINRLPAPDRDEVLAALAIRAESVAGGAA